MITPGAYLKALRRGARLSLNDMAARIDTVPHLTDFERAGWLERIEADIVPMDLSTLAVLSRVYPFDIAVIFELERHRSGIEEATTPLCILCGKTDRTKCTAGHEAACRWTAPPKSAGATA
ncbi:helix-turn-helix domain-containing protein [Sphingomonas yabuuchiae]|uniref:Helix-turn-helix domain-containing protein n=1 Tax=Sphingomonas yabuuchiae TaxID=172044 RepID=A0AA40ZX36_9SPHN|nr:helix-turn-helix domain-containing protein [Sphingomonas yabuuchiae]MBB4609617.1 transcriptional regulator with XRE-family HTH domain [Sphingomonas yabuuchiae]MBN3557930.1 helix-turn-helix domain-containing protein [Sphingomonas yabuuchiae]